MIAIESTENLAGVTISGDLEDLNQLVEAFYEITVDEYDEKHSSYIDISTRILALCYDARHAFMGHREVTLINNGMDDAKMKHHLIIAPKTNVYYTFNYLYPEMFFVMLALNDLVKLRIKTHSKPKNDYTGALNKNIIWDETIAVIRSFQAAFVKCIKTVLTEATFTRWLNVMNSSYNSIIGIVNPFIDSHNIKYLKMTKETRLKKLSPIAKKLSEYYYDKDHQQMERTIIKAAHENNCSKSDIRLQGFEYPEVIEW